MAPTTAPTIEEQLKGANAALQGDACRVSDRADAARDWSQTLFMPAILIVGVVVGWISWTRYYNPDEYEALHQGWLLFAGQVQFTDFNSNHPPILFELLRLLNHVTTDALTQMHIARCGALISFFVVMWLIYRIARVVYDDAAARWAVILYAINATLWAWAIEIRTDTLLVPLWLTAVVLLVDKGKLSAHARLATIGVLLGLAFWCNQKAALHSIPLGIYIMLGGPGRNWKWSAIFLAVGASLIPTAIVLARLAYLGAFEDMVENVFYSGADLFAYDPYQSFRGFTLKTVLWRDLGMVTIGVFAVGWAVRRWPTASRNERFTTLSACWMMATFLATPGPFGYYMMSVFPLVLITCGGYLSQAEWIQLSRSEHSKFACLCAAFCLFPLMWLSKYLVPSNTYQAQAIRLATELTDEDTYVYDLSGSLVSRPDPYPFFTRLSRKEMPRFAERLGPLIPQLQSHHIRLAMFGDRVRVWRNLEERAIVNRQFVQLWGPLYVPGYDSHELVDEGQAEIELWYDGTYESQTPGLMINGQPWTDPIPLEAGRYTVTLSHPGQRIKIRDAWYLGRIEIPEVNPNEILFNFRHWNFR